MSRTAVDSIEVIYKCDPIGHHESSCWKQRDCSHWTETGKSGQHTTILQWYIQWNLWTRDTMGPKRLSTVYYVPVVPSQIIHETLVERSPLSRRVPYWRFHCNYIVQCEFTNCFFLVRWNHSISLEGQVQSQTLPNTWRRSRPLLDWATTSPLPPSGRESIATSWGTQTSVSLQLSLIQAGATY